jgi:ABC-type phosphate/phosphonate transport system substrate-binding protein
MKRFVLTSVVLCLLSLGLKPFCLVQAEANLLLKVGLARTQFRDLPLGKAATKPFEELVRSQVGVRGEVTLHENSAILLKELTSGNLEVVVLQGFEFAWLAKKNPKLKPLVVSIPKVREIRGILVVGKDSSITEISQLGKSDVIIPVGTKDHSLLFWDDICKRCKLNHSLASSRGQSSVEESLEDLVDGVSRAVLIEEATWKSFEANKPGRAKKLRVLERSEPFPSGVIAYLEGAVDPVLLEKTRAGLIKANQNSKANLYLSMIRVERFEVADENYLKLLDSCADRYEPAQMERLRLAVK